MSAIPLALMGTAGCGKSCLCIRLIADRFVEDYEPTLEDLFRKQLDVDGRVTVIDVFDTAGIEEFTLIRDNFVRKGKGFLCVYAINDRQSFEEITKIYDFIVRVKDGDVPVVLVGTKKDLEQQREVSTEEAQELARQIGGKYIETSSLTGENVQEAFILLLRQIHASEPPPSHQKQKGKKWDCILL